MLSPDEEAAGRRLAVLRKAEDERVGPRFPPARSFLHDETKRLVAESPLLEVMRRLPKGGILHLHGSAGGDFHGLVAQALVPPGLLRVHGRRRAGPPCAARCALPEPPEGAWRPLVRR